MDRLKRCILLVVLILLLSNAFTYASDTKKTSPNIIFDIPVFDYRFNLSNGFSYPGMQQSLYLSKDWLQLAHWQIDNLIGLKRHPVLAYSGIIVFDIGSRFLPLGISWMHEEWHRSNLSIRNIDSNNAVFNFKMESGGFQVDQVKDEDLIRFKADHPAEFVRMSSAGIESNYELNMEL